MSRPLPFFQRAIVAWCLEDGAGRQRIIEVRHEGFKKRRNSTWDGFAWRPGERAVAARLSCNHWKRLVRLWTPTTKWGPSLRKRGPLTENAPCRACGAGDRRAAEESKAREILRDAIAGVARDAVRFPFLVELVWEGMRASRLHPTNAAAEGIYEAIDRNARMAGLHDKPTDDSEGDVDGTEEEPRPMPRESPIGAGPRSMGRP